MPSLPFRNDPPSGPLDPGEAGTLRLKLQRSWLAAGGRPPRVTLDGHPVGVAWGSNTLPLRGGRWFVEVECSLRGRRYGYAGTGVDVVAGRTTELHYAPPWTYVDGRIGEHPQRSPGLLLLLVVTAVLLVLGVVVGVLR